MVRLNCFSLACSGPYICTCSVYHEHLYIPFADSIARVSDENSIIFIGLTRSFCKPHFFGLLSERGISYTLLPQEALPAEYSNESSGRDVGIFMCRKVKPAY